MLTCRKNLLLSAVVLLASWITTSGQARAGDLPGGVQKTQALIESRHSEIIVFAHRITSNRGVDYDGARKLDDGYALTFTFRWDGAIWTNQYTKIRFLVENSGRISSLSVEGTTCRHVPFETDLKPNDLQARRSMMAKHPKVKNSVTMLQRVNNASAKELCLLYLNLELGHE